MLFNFGTSRCKEQQKPRCEEQQVGRRKFAAEELKRYDGSDGRLSACHQLAYLCAPVFLSAVVSPVVSFLDSNRRLIRFSQFVLTRSLPGFFHFFPKVLVLRDAPLFYQKI